MQPTLQVSEECLSKGTLGNVSVPSILRREDEPDQAHVSVGAAGGSSSLSSQRWRKQSQQKRQKPQASRMKVTSPVRHGSSRPASLGSVLSPATATRRHLMMFEVVFYFFYEGQKIIQSCASYCFMKY